MIVILESNDVREESKEKDIFSLRIHDFRIFDNQLIYNAELIVFATGFRNDDGKELYIGLKDREQETPYVYTD